MSKEEPGVCWPVYLSIGCGIIILAAALLKPRATLGDGEEIRATPPCWNGSLRILCATVGT